MSCGFSLRHQSELLAAAERGAQPLICLKIWAYEGVPLRDAMLVMLGHERERRLEQLLADRIDQA